MNSRGHTVTSIYMSGGQAKNILLMELFANICGMPVVLPYSHSLAVVLGAAMLGRFAHEASREKLGDEQIGERLWNIMVKFTRVVVE
jgi:ribulose kinase